MPRLAAISAASAPVTQTARHHRRADRSAMLLDERDGILDRQDLFRRIIGNFATEFFFKCHHELDRVEAVRPKIVDEARVLGDLALLDTEMFHYDLFHALGDVTHFSVSLDSFGNVEAPSLLGNVSIR